jgi:two-component system, OmpR family, alkaline phosphatase synthesis response regulator PhoP
MTRLPVAGAALRRIGSPREDAVDAQAGRARVLVVDDEPSLVNLVRSYLEAEGFLVFEAYGGHAALTVAEREAPDLVVLDLMLPGLDGIEVCRRLRHFSNAFVLMLTSKSAEVDKLIGLSVGADDYMTKPFSPRELVARVKAMLRRAQMGAVSGAGRLAPDIPPPVVFGDLIVDVARHEATKGGRIVKLTPREFDLLAALSAHPGLVFTRAQLLNRVWGDDLYDGRLVDVHITALRKKLDDDPARPRYIETVRGVGFRFGPRSASSPSPPAAPPRSLGPTATTPPSSTPHEDGPENR